MQDDVKATLNLDVCSHKTALVCSLHPQDIEFLSVTDFNTRDLSE